MRNQNLLADVLKLWARDWGQEEKGTTEDEMAGWHHWLDGCESEWTPGVGDGQGGLAYCDSWGCKELEMTERLNWTELRNQLSVKLLLWDLLSQVLPHLGFPEGSMGKESARQCRRRRRHSFNLWIRKIPWRWAWLSTPVFLPEESHGQRSLVGYSPWGHKESDMTERLCMYAPFFMFNLVCSSTEDTKYISSV